MAWAAAQPFTPETEDGQHCEVPFLAAFLYKASCASRCAVEKPDLPNS